MLLSLGVAACGDGGSDSRFLSIATGGTGGVYYPYGGGLARLLDEYVPGIRATAEVTSASVDNLKLIRDGRADLAFTLADTLSDAVRGAAAFEGRPVPVRSLAVLYSNYTHVVTLASSGIAGVADLRGRRVSVGSPGSGTEVIALRVLRAAGLDPEADVRRQGLGATESADALKDGKIDAFFFSGGLPTAAIQDLAHTQGIAIRLLPTGDLLPVLQAAEPGLYTALDMPAGVYPGVEAAVPVVGVANVLVCPAAMDEDLAYAITRVLFEHQDQLADVHPEARKLSPARGAGGAPAPYHPGALRYYRERGIQAADAAR